MRFEQRMYARVRFLELLAELYESAFEDFFHNLMCARFPSFVDVRTHGNLGDQGADGLALHSRKLYACYAPQTVNVSAVQSKFSSDLAKATKKRKGQFDTFVFVHNDRRGMHPQISTMISQASSAHYPLSFEQMGARRLWHECLQLDQAMAEEVLGCEIPIRPMAAGIGMDDLAPLLKHLKELRAQADPLMVMPEVPQDKLDFNLLRGDARDDLVRGMRNSHLVDAFYEGSVRELEHDEVAQGFRMYYEQVRREWEDPEDVLWQLQMYILGNALQHPRMHRAAWVVIAHFFERCDIFEAPPPGWTPDGFLGMPA